MIATVEMILFWMSHSTQPVLTAREIFLFDAGAVNVQRHSLGKFRHKWLKKHGR